jgi:tetratricopeptide (TPR) repeat protein
MYLTRGLALATQGDTNSRRDLREAVRVYQSLVRTDSLSAEAWYGLGDAQNHLSNSLPSNEGFAELANGSMAAFRRALDIDPDFHLAYSHLIDMYRAWSQPQNNFILRGDSIFPEDSIPVERRAALRDAAQGRAISTAADWLAADATATQPYRSLALSLRAANRSDSAATVLRTGARRTGATGGVLLMDAAFDEFIAGSPALRGVVDSAMSSVSPAILSRRTRSEQFNFLSLGVGLGAASGSSRLLERGAEYWTSEESPSGFTDLIPEGYVPWMLSTFRLAMGEELTPALRRALIAGARTVDRASGDTADQLRRTAAPLAYLIFLATRDSTVGAMAQRWQSNVRMIELDAMRALAEGDTARARAIALDFPTVDSLRSTNFGLAGMRTMTRAEVLAQLGDLRAAVGNYEALAPSRFAFNSPNEPGLPLYIRSFAARGRLYEQLGEPEKARTAYEKYLELWSVDDPVTARERGEVRAAIARLRDAPRTR